MTTPDDPISVLRALVAYDDQTDNSAEAQDLWEAIMVHARKLVEAADRGEVRTVTEHGVWWEADDPNAATAEVEPLKWHMPRAEYDDLYGPEDNHPRGSCKRQVTTVTGPWVPVERPARRSRDDSR